MFTGSVQKQSAHRWSILTHGDQIECKFRHDPIRFSRAKNGTIQVKVDKNNTIGPNQKGELRLRFNQVIVGNDASGLPKKNKTLIDVPVNSSFIKYPLPEAGIPHTGYILKGSIKINTLELVRNEKVLIQNK